MEALDLVKSIVSSLSYLIAASSFFGDTKKIRCIAYFLLIHSVDVYFTLNGWEVYANYVYLVITTLFISREYSYLKSFSFAITIFAAFQWTIAFVGSIGFLILPFVHNGSSFDLPFVLYLSIAHMVVALSLNTFYHFVFKDDIGKNLLFIDIGAKSSFIIFFNLFLPGYFEILGMRDYAIMSLVLLVIALIFVLYRKYSIALEKQVANLTMVNQWAEQINAINKVSKLPGNSDANENFNEGINRSIDGIKNPVVQALLHELANASEKFGVFLNIYTNLEQDINLNNYDLFNIISNFIVRALNETKFAIKKSICVEIDNKSGVFRFMIQTSTAAKQLNNDLPFDYNSLTDLEFEVSEVTISDSSNTRYNIITSFFEDDRFVQILEIR